MNILKTLTVAALATFIFAPATFAADSEGGKHYGEHKGKMFEKHDTNDDGVISKEEFMSEAEARFAQMDSDGDGNFSKEEAEAFHEKMREKMKEYKDKNKAE